MYRVTYLAVIVFIVFTSCKKDDTSSEGQSDIANFYAHQVGNTWTYNYYGRGVGSTDEFEDLNVTDIVLITETSEINGETYYTFQTTTTGVYGIIVPDEGVVTEKIRDSLGYLINLEGEILYSNENLQDYIISENSWGNVYGVLKGAATSITVEAGTFNSFENEIYLILPDSSTAPGRDRIFYSDRMGQVKRNYSYVTEPIHRWERRLTEFTLAE